ncbi:MAG: type II toxin-antitoxin system VapC family toxin [Anaerolineales bacterium]
MILYMDASAMVKRYVAEVGSQEVNTWIKNARMVTTALVSRAEVSAALNRAARLQMIKSADCQSALDLFRNEWESFIRLPVSEFTVQRADQLACRHNLRGYDAIHLACALIWQESIGDVVTIATYDQQLHQAALDEGISLLP